MPSQQEIDEQQELLITHRKTLLVLLKQRAQHTEAYVPPSIENGILLARDNIHHCKETLRTWGITVDDHPNDTDYIKTKDNQRTIRTVIPKWLPITIGVSALFFATIIIWQTFNTNRTSQFSEATALALTQNARLIYGPSSGSLSNYPDAVTFSDSKIKVSNFEAEVTFTNPYSANEGPWSYGLMFRRWQNEEKQYGYFYYYVTSDGKWYVKGSHPKNGNTFFNGQVPNLNLDISETNKLKIIAIDKSASIFINDKYIETVDISKNLEPGNITVATGFDQKGISEKKTSYMITIRSSDK